MTCLTCSSRIRECMESADKSTHESGIRNESCVINGLSLLHLDKARNLS